MPSMARMNGNRKPADIPDWGWVMLLEFREQAAENRKQATEDRKQATEDRKQAAEDRREIRDAVKGLREDFHMLAQLQVTMAERLADNDAHMHLMRADMKEVLHELKAHRGLLKDILTAIRARGNGRFGNGHPRKES